MENGKDEKAGFLDIVVREYNGCHGDRNFWLTSYNRYRRPVSASWAQRLITLSGWVLCRFDFGLDLFHSRRAV
jgi:hypothetical protein